MTAQIDSNAAAFRFLRVNPFRGLLVDEKTWADAHDYHRNHMRFHLLTMHGRGIVQGLEVTAQQPPSLNVTVGPGVAIDSEGRSLLLTKAQPLTLPKPASLTTIFVVLEFNEKVTQLQNVTEGGQPQAARVLEDCQVRASLETVPGAVELARINFDLTTGPIVRNATDPRQPGRNEIDLNGRTLVADRAGSEAAGGRPVRQNLTVGILRTGPANSTEWKRHSEGLRRLLRDTSNQTNLDGNLLEGVSPLDEATLRNCRLLYLTGRSAFRYTPEEEQGLRRFLDRGGLVWCEPCRNGLPSGSPDEFSRSCIELLQRLNRQPVQPRPGHPLFGSRYLFAAPPPAIDPRGTVLEGNRGVIATGDYGCLWEGHGQERADPPSRETLRSVGEFGANLLFWAAGQS